MISNPEFASGNEVKERRHWFGHFLNWSSLFLAIVVLLGCKGPTSASPVMGDPLKGLLGCYSTRKGGDAEIRVRKHQGKYLLSIAADWSDEVEGAEPTEEEVKELFKDQSSFYIAGLYSGALGIFEVRPGMRVNNSVVEGSHVVVILFGAGEAYDATCPN
ncbi:MAG TPA: hypothetical protein VF756_15410 [Thermoanaerobaculia bacterium]